VIVHFNAIFARKHGEAEPVLVATGSLQEVEAKYEDLVGPKSQDWRDEHAEMVYYRRGEKHAYHAFESKKSRITQEALRAHRSHEQAAAMLERATAKHAESLATLADLSDEHRELLKAHLEKEKEEVGNA